MTEYDRPLTPQEIRAVKDENIDFSDIEELSAVRAIMPIWVAEPLSARLPHG